MMDETASIRRAPPAPVGRQAPTGQAANALAFYRDLLSREPDHPHAWRQLADALAAQGDIEAAQAAYLRQVTASAADPEMRDAALALAANRLDFAERALRGILRARPTEVAAMRMLAELAVRIGRLNDAENLLDRALELAPGFAAARHNRAVVRHRRGRSSTAVLDIDLLLADEPDNPAYLATRAAIAGRAGDYDTAVQIYEKLIATLGDGCDARLWLSYGHALKTLGRTQDCVRAYRKATEADVALGEAWWSLANLKTFAFSDDDIATMSHARAMPQVSADNAVHLDFALGNALEARALPEDAMRHYLAANAGRRAQLPFDRGQITAHVDSVIGHFTPALIEQHRDSGAAAADPIFVLGLPRSGSTLIEQILASHPDVEGTMELPDIIAIAERLEDGAGQDAPGYMPQLARCSREELTQMGAQYLQSTRVHRREGRRLFVDKMPNNWLHTALIHLILPNATIIDARRHPLDCCISCFSQHFARGQGFSYDLADLGHYYADYVRLMAHVDAMLPGRVHRVFHEQLVADPETQIRSLLSACGLEFHPDCMEFHRNRRAVRTASAEQVRQPLSSRGIGRWRAFDPWLEPLRTALGEALDTYPAV